MKRGNVLDSRPITARIESILEVFSSNAKKRAFLEIKKITQNYQRILMYRSIAQNLEGIEAMVLTLEQFADRID